VFRRNGMQVLSRTRAETVVRDGDEVVVTLTDGTEVRGSHCLMAVGSIPNTADLGLEKAGIDTTESGHIVVNRVARTSVPNVYAAGDCTNFFPLASVASTQGRTAVFHALGDEVRPINLRNVASNVFTYPEIATVGWQEKDIEEGKRSGRVHKLELSQNPRAKMQGFRDGFVKLIAGNNLGVIVGGVVVAPRASELLLALSVAIEQRLTVDEFASSWAVYPSLSGSIVDAARDMHVHLD
jgi:dihydrolipoamide dehydrogenase